MNIVDASLVALRASTAALLQGIEAEQWSDDDVRQPSLVPAWTRAHVLTHLARNADGISRTVSGALRAEIVPRYPDGPTGRAADIEAGARRGSSELLADVRESAECLDHVFTAVAEVDGWNLATEDRLAAEYVTARRREVEVHRLDLGGVYSAADWPPDFVASLLPELVDGLEKRATSALRLEVCHPGSVTPELPGRTWNVGDAVAAEVVTGPDWAMLAWLIGRPSAARNALSDTPRLANWI